jgi:hypothetical protein
MSEENKGTTVSLDADTIIKADAIARQLGALVGGKMSRSAVTRRAIHDLFLALCPIDTTNDHDIGQSADVSA